ncbi:MAG TPA: M28 family peptidase [Vicinamibacterales bacterium]|nr:M28 family peptidase [Vicinamibacterales bacterium]
MASRVVSCCALLLTLSAAAQQPQPGIDSDTLMRDLEVLSADAMEGRRAGTPGGARARAYIVERFRRAGIEPFGTTYEKPFTFRTSQEGPAQQGVNVAGAIRGRRPDGPWMAVTAHYDHLGVRNGQVFNGADDNASGVAALLAVATTFRDLPPEHPILFAALDAEESGLHGARALLAAPPVPLHSIALNVNLDMVARDESNELFAVGTHHYPFLKPYLQDIAVPPVELRFGHDGPNAMGTDWTRDSDHFVFHQAGIPFVYFGVEDAVHYHKVTDDAETVSKAFFVAAVTTIAMAIRRLDAHLGAIRRNRK